MVVYLSQEWIYEIGKRLWFQKINNENCYLRVIDIKMTNILQKLMT